MSKNIADLIVETLQKAGVKRIYGGHGERLDGLSVSIRHRGSIEWVHVQHEEVAAFAASGESQVTEELAVCAGSCGPGNLHLIVGLYDANRARSPVLAIVAQIPSAEVGGDSFGENCPQMLFKDCSVYCELVSGPEQMPYVLENAIREAVGKRGVAVIVLQGDVILMPAPQRGPSSNAGMLPPVPLVLPAAKELDALADLLNSSDRITLLCGRGCAGAHDELMQLADALKSPIVHSLAGKEHVAYDNPYDVGIAGFVGYSSGYAAIHRCEVLLMVGTDFPYKQFFPTHVKVAQIDIRPENLGRRCKLELGVVGHAGATLEALTPKIKRKTNLQHLNDSIAHYQSARMNLKDRPKGPPGRNPSHPQYLAQLISEQASEDTVFTFDVASIIVWAARYLQMNGRRRLIGSVSRGSMSNAMPQALGIQAAQPWRQVVSLSGDSGFTMLTGDLITLTQMKLPVKVIIFNTSLHEFVPEMKAAGFGEVGTDLPNFAATAWSMGMFSRRVDDPSDLPGAIAALFAHDGPGLLDVVTSSPKVAMPPTIELTGNFSLWPLCAVLSDGGDKIIDLATIDLSPH